MEIPPFWLFYYLGGWIPLLVVCLAVVCPVRLLGEMLMDKSIAMDRQSYE